MRDIRFIVLSSLLSFLAACATPYSKTGLTGGFTEKELTENVWRVKFSGNGFTSRETVQTYWLYRSAELTLEKGFQGFDVITRTPFLSKVPGIPEPVEVAATTPVYIPIYSGPVYTPLIEADIRLIHRPFQAAPPKVFDAAELKGALEPIVTGTKCENGNVCPHVHTYLFKNGDITQPDTSSGSSREILRGDETASP